jgi:hypothetical protein
MADIADEVFLQLPQLPVMAPGAVDDRKTDKYERHAQDDEEQVRAALIPYLKLEFCVVSGNQLKNPFVQRVREPGLKKILGRA